LPYNLIKFINVIFLQLEEHRFCMKSPVSSRAPRRARRHE